MRANITKARRGKPPLDSDALLDNAHRTSEFLKALSHESRLAILCLLLEGEKTVGDIEEVLKLRQSTVSQQLARLRADDLVKMRRNGKNVYYSVERPEVIEVISALYRCFCKS
jgi:ArsR family transcriptional regulator, virulence genes transcriptional regulator